MNYVDLGLSVLWGTCNIGAYSQQKKGDRYSYGETETKEDYSFKSYKHGRTISVEVYDVPPMYQMYASPKMEDYPEYDNIGNILGTSMDVASLYFGDSVRMPSKKEIEELLAKCTQQPEEGGVRFISPNGNSIFMPYGDYWSGTLNPYRGSGYYDIYDTTEHFAYSLKIDPKEAKATSTDNCREEGLLIRPVKKREWLTTGLMGVVCGDVAGLPYEFKGHRTKDYFFPFLANDFSDDTILTMAVARWLLGGELTAKKLRALYLEYAKRFIEKNVWGTGFMEWVKSGGTLDRTGVRSNGAAMRAVPIGYASDNISEVRRLADLSARITHNSDEASRGAQAVAVTTMLARQHRSKQEIADCITNLFGYDLKRTTYEIRKTYQFEIFCDLCVPESIICFLESDNYESVIRNAVSLGGDADTMAAIAGGIATAYGMPIPEDMACDCFQLLPADFIQTLEEFSALLT